MSLAIGATCSTSVANGSGATLLQMPWSGNTVANSYLIVGLVFSGNPGTITVKYSTTSYAQLGSTVSNGTAVYTAAFGLVNAASQLTTTDLEISWANDVVCAVAYGIEIQGAATSSAQDGSNETATASSASMAGGAITTSNAAAIIVGILGQAEGADPTVSLSTPTPTGSTLLSITARNTTGGEHFIAALGLNYQIVSTIQTSYTPGCTSTVSTTWAGITVAIKGAAAPAPPAFQVITTYPQVWDSYRSNYFELPQKG
jgi:hypothetical protein